MQLRELGSDKSLQVVDDGMKWFAMRVTYNREMQVKQSLDLAHITSYLPLRRVVKLRGGKHVFTAIPAVRGLMFAYCTRGVISDFKKKLPHLQFITKREGEKNTPIIVPDDEMKSFIQATSIDASRIQYVDPLTQNFARGTRVKIHGGELDGIVGRYMRITGKRAKRLLVQVENITAVAVDVTTVNYIEVLQ